MLSTPVYSLVTQGSSGRQTMNMITYASPIALRPTRKYALGLYVQSLTYQNMKETGRGVLQVRAEGAAAAGVGVHAEALAGACAKGKGRRRTGVSRRHDKRRSSRRVVLRPVQPHIHT